MSDEGSCDSSIMVDNEQTKDRLLGDERNWIKWYCSLNKNAMLCEIQINYFDNFNLCGLEDIVPNYRYALALIKGTKHC